MIIFLFVFNLSVSNQNNQYREPKYIPQSNINQPPKQTSQSVPRSKGPLIAQQNHYYSDKLKLDNASVRFEKMLDLKINGNITTFIVMNPKVVIVGSDNGTMAILNRYL